TVTVVTLALGIGANAAIFSVLEGILLKPLPYPEPDRLIVVDHAAPGVNLKSAGMAAFLYFTYREQNRTLQDIGMWGVDSLSVTGLAEPEEVPGVDVTDGVLPMLGAHPLLGRIFTRADDAAGSPLTVILSHDYWQRRFGGERSVLGRRMMLDGRSAEVIGVLPANFRFMDRKSDLYLPMQRDRSKVVLGGFSYQSVVRLKPGVSIAQAKADLARMIPIAIQSFPPFPGSSVKMFEQVGLRPDLRLLKQDLVGDVGNVLWVLMGTIGMVLLIACANVANLLLVRTEGRQHELAIRVALGANWGQIASALLVESLTLGIAGGAAGLALAYGAVRLLASIAPANLPRLNEISIDGPVLLFTLLVSLVASAAFGAVPVFKYAGPQLSQSLRSGGRGSSHSRERHRARSVLVVVQVGLALVLLIGSGLMIRSFQTLRNVDPGFTRPEEVQTVRFGIPSAEIKEGVRVVRMEQEIADKVAAIPGVESVGLTSKLPLDGSGWHDPIYAEDHVYAESQVPPLRSYKIVSPGLAKAIGNRMIAGRDLTWTDVYDKRPVAMVTENLARELWGDAGRALGRRIRDGRKSAWREVVGVVADERDDGIHKPAPATVMFPLLMDHFGSGEEFVQRGVRIVIRSKRTGSQGFIDEVSRAVWSVNPSLPLANVRTLDEIYRKSMARTSFTLVMLAIAGGMALLLGIIGIYGVISYAVSQRTREIGIRMALGSSQREVTRLFVAHGLRLAAIGIVCGLAVAAVCTRLLTSMLFEVSPLDPATFAGVAATLAVAAGVASYVPALRAAVVDPAEALRGE
ncbi:MAG: Multidrug transporter substrate-binding protein, partial [Candidatus Solibacter sp.]|nr:Multidrug transporter substrate-binding protein [Candidatus Solibacter sp.]